MRRLYKVIALVTTLAITLATGIIVHRLVFKSHVWLSTSSPSGTYTVELTGNKSRSFYHVVRFNLIKNGQPVIENAYAHSGDWMDISFELAYPEHAWVNENAIRFWRNPDVPDDKSDTLLISNDTGKVIRYLKIYAKDMFLVFDVQPKSSHRLSFSHQYEGSWIDCEGEFDDGQRIEASGVSFSRSDKLNEPMRYCMSIGDSRVKIESPQAEGYESGSDWKKPDVPRAMNCNP